MEQTVNQHPIDKQQQRGRRRLIGSPAFSYTELSLTLPIPARTAAAWQYRYKFPRWPLPPPHVTNARVRLFSAARRYSSSLIFPIPVVALIFVGR